jgi:uncharacterized membrane protein
MRLRQIISSRPRLVAAVAVGLLVYWFVPFPKVRLILGWDAGAGLFLVVNAILMAITPPHRMPAEAAAQQDGEWTIFAMTLGGVVASVFAIILEFSAIKNLHGSERASHVMVLVTTLIISWLTMHLVFALRYAHEFYTKEDDELQGGLDFPKEPEPDYYDFLYFSLVLGMTFQVSDVDITDRHLRRLATLQGFISFLFNTIILALTVNLAAGLM